MEKTNVDLGPRLGRMCSRLRHNLRYTRLPRTRSTSVILQAQCACKEIARETTTRGVRSPVRILVIYPAEKVKATLGERVRIARIRRFEMEYIFDAECEAKESSSGQNAPSSAWCEVF